MNEIGQSPQIRQTIIADIETLLGRKVVTYFTSFQFPVMIEDTDADMLEGVLQGLGSGHPLTLLVSSPGGHGLAAERLINVCRSYSGGNFEVIVPKMAKSAATMLCLGAQKIYMSDTSELGPIDPQVTVRTENGTYTFLSVWSILRSYKDLLQQAVATEGHIDPYLQQLSRYDSRQIKQWELEATLSETIAIKSLQTGMMEGKCENEIKEKIKKLLEPEETKSHGRPIFWQAAKEMGLCIEYVKHHMPLWQDVWELYIRTNNFVNSRASKVIETTEHALAAPPPQMVPPSTEQQGG